MIPGFFFRRRLKKAPELGDGGFYETLKRTGTWLLAISVVHVVLMLNLEGMSIGDAIWLTFTTLLTVGYGDLSPATTEGRMATIILLYLGGIFVLANLAGAFLEWRAEHRQRMLKGNWRWNMKDHILIINTPATGGVSYFVRLVDQIRADKRYENTPIQILTRQFPEGLPEELRKKRIVHHTGYPDQAESLEAVSITDAAAIIILSKDEYDKTSDALTFDILHRLKEIGVKNIPIIAECVDDSNRKRLTSAGATVTVRPIRAYPEIIVRSLFAPGSEKVLENLFRHEGDHQQRFNIELKNVTWGDVVCSLMTRGYGTAMAYVGTDNEPVCNADPSTMVDAKALIIMVRENKIPSQTDIVNALKSIQPTIYAGLTGQEN